MPEERRGKWESYHALSVCALQLIVAILAGRQRCNRIRARLAVERNFIAGKKWMLFSGN